MRNIRDASVMLARAQQTLECASRVDLAGARALRARMRLAELKVALAGARGGLQTLDNSLQNIANLRREIMRSRIVPRTNKEFRIVFMPAEFFRNRIKSLVAAIMAQEEVLEALLKEGA